MATQLVPLDYAILAALPKQGAMAGLHDLGATAKHLARKWRTEQVTSAQLNGRLRSLREMGLIVSVVVLPTGAGLGWQITPKGETVLAEHRRGRVEVTVLPGGGQA